MPLVTQGLILLDLSFLNGKQSLCMSVKFFDKVIIIYGRIFIIFTFSPISTI